MKRIQLLIAFSLALILQTCEPVFAGGSYHASLSGTPSGAGTLSSPLEIRTAILRTSWSPGDTVWIHGGVYVGNGFEFMPNGTTALPVVFRNWNNERVIFSDNSGSEIIGFLKGANCWLWGLEFRSTVAVANAAGVQMGGAGSKMINCYIHDTQTTGVTSQQSTGTEIYGTIFQYCGRFIPPPPASVSGGYSIYIQNVIGAGPKWVTDNIFGFAYGPSVHAYTQGATISNLIFEGNVVFGTGLLWRGNRWEANFLAGSTGIPGDSDVLRANVFYHAPEYPYGKNFLSLYSNVTNALVTGNYFVSPNQGIAFELNGTGTVTNNYVVGSTNLPTGTGNTYLSSWPTTAQPVVIMRPNKYEAGRANITVLNWNKSASVSVNLASVLSVGDTYRVVDAMNYYGTPVASGTYMGGSISLPMAPGTMAAPLGSPAAQPYEEQGFRVFVLLGKTSGPVVPPPPVQLPTAVFNASPLTLDAPGIVRLTWTSTNAVTASISGVGSVALSGQMDVVVTSTRTFTFTVGNSAGSGNYSRTVIVNAVVPPPPPPPPVSAYDAVTVLGVTFQIRKANTDTTIFVPVRIQKGQ